MQSKRNVSKLLFALASAIYLVGAVAHARAYAASAGRIIGESTAKAFFANELRVLWLADSATLMGLAILFGLMAHRPELAAKRMILFLTWIPGATTALLYYFLGPFYAAHMLLAATLMVVLAALLLPDNLAAGGCESPGHADTQVVSHTGASPAASHS